MEPRNKIFISHSSLDKNLVETFVNSILKLGLGISEKRIFCSSMEGHGIKGGKYIPEALKSELQKSCIAILIISNNYKQSEVCLNEIGASWVSLADDKVIPFLTNDIGFEEIGFLNLNKMSLNISNKIDIIKFCDENKQDLCSNDINYQLLDKNIDRFISQLRSFSESDLEETIDFAGISEEELCWDICIYPFGKISQEQFPEYSDELIHTSRKEEIDSLLSKVANLKFREHLLWYSYEGGDIWFTKLKQLKNGNWVLGSNDLAIEEIWINASNSYYDEFILIKTKAQAPFKIDTTGKESFYAGVTEDGIVVSENEWGNGYFKLNNKICRIDKDKGGFYRRHDKVHYFFIATKYHSVIHNYDRTREFCKKIDKLKRALKPKELILFIDTLDKHPLVSSLL